MVAVEVPELGLRAPGCRPEISWASGMDLNQRMIWIEARQIGLQIAHREQLTGRVSDAYQVAAPTETRTPPSTERISLTKECGWKDGDRGGLS